MPHVPLLLMRRIYSSSLSKEHVEMIFISKDRDSYRSGIISFKNAGYIKFY